MVMCESRNVKQALPEQLRLEQGLIPSLQASTAAKHMQMWRARGKRGTFLCILFELGGNAAYATQLENFLLWSCLLPFQLVLNPLLKTWQIPGKAGDS